MLVGAGMQNTSQITIVVAGHFENLEPQDVLMCDILNVFVLDSRRVLAGNLDLSRATYVL